MDPISILKYHIDRDPIDDAASLTLAAHRSFVRRMESLLCIERDDGHEEHGSLSEVEALSMEVCRLRQQLARLA